MARERPPSALSRDSRAPIVRGSSAPLSGTRASEHSGQVRGTSQRGRAARARLSAQAQPGRQRALGYRIGARRRPLTAGRAQTAAKARLARFRRGSRLAVALTALLLIVWGVDAPAQEQAADTTTAASPAETLSVVVPLDTAGVVADSLPAEDTSSVDAAASVGEATGTLRSLARGAARALPKVAIALGLLLAAALLARVARSVVRRLTSGWERGDAFGVLVAIGIWMLALAAAIAVVAGDARTVVGSVGLIGLALSWALQGPIESFTGWLLNSFRGYYRVGDRVSVGDVFGDVFRIDLITTTVWEAGGPGKPVQGAQPTGALVTFPNSEVLRNNVVNYTRDFPYVWDEITVGVTNESDLRYAIDVVRATAKRVIGDRMVEPTTAYRNLLARRRLDQDVADEPQVFAVATEAWTDLTVRYLVPARERRKWASELTIAMAEETGRPEHRGRMESSYPYRRVELVGGEPGESAGA